jgi:small subunit ribosomal protein S6
MLLLRPDLEDDKLQAAVEKVTRAIVNGGGSLSKVSPWGKRRLAYDIGQHREASYFLIHFDIDPSQIREIERGMLISEEILRHLVTVLEDRGTSDEELAPAVAPREDAPVPPLADEGTDAVDATATDSGEATEVAAEDGAAETDDDEPTEAAADEEPAEAERTAG